MNYDYNIKDIVNINKFFSREDKINEDKEKSIESIKNRRLTSQIKKLPCETQKKVYIYAIKKYWKEHVLDTIKIGIKKVINIIIKTAPIIVFVNSL